MFCPKCGKENNNQNQFCGGCGVTLIHTSQNNAQIRTGYAPDAVMIIIGVLIILGLYTVQLSHMTIAEWSSACHLQYLNDISLGRDYVRSCTQTDTILYGGWILGLIFIVGGIFLSTIRKKSN